MVCYSFVYMKRIFRDLICVLVMSCFVSCSWVEQFVIYNKSEKAIYVSYEIKDDRTFPIFYDHPVVHGLTKSGCIDWASEMQVTDEDGLITKVRVAIPAHSALIFGALHNDKYASNDQKFINDRKFNLMHMQIMAYGKILDVIPSTFDRYFKKHQGQIYFTVK